MFIATLIAAERLTSADISAAEDALRSAGIEPTGRRWIEPDIACDIHLSAPGNLARHALEALLPGVDVIVQREAGRAKKLLIADMDSTMITVECIDELADYAGFKAEVAAVTERAMRGEIAFEAALRERVSALRGLDARAIDACRAERVRITPGASALVRTMKAKGARCLLVSGGFTAFADPVAREIGFDRAIANRLGIEQGKLNGRVAEPIVGADAKRRALMDAAAELAVPLESTLAIGDGANDIPMIEAAGLSVAYRAKPKVAAMADARIEATDLSALLYAQGYPRADWAA